MTKVISALQTKGGAGKSSTIRMLAAQLAHMGNTVVIVDTDPQRSCIRWLEIASQKNNKIERVAAKEIYQLSDVEPFISSLMGKVDYILCDVQGAAVNMMLPICKVSDLILLPWSPTEDDWYSLIDTYNIIKNIMESDPSVKPAIALSLNRITATDMHHSFVKNRAKAAEKLGVINIETMIWKRQATANMLRKLGSIPQMTSKVSGILKAQEEHELFANEIINVLATLDGKVS